LAVEALYGMVAAGECDGDVSLHRDYDVVMGSGQCVRTPVEPIRPILFVATAIPGDGGQQRPVFERFEPQFVGEAHVFSPTAVEKTATRRNGTTGTDRG
jgi:hypothetical protein